MKANVIRSAVIDAPIDRVWSVLRDFNSHHRWHPAVSTSQMENDLDGDVVGGVRRFSLSDGAELREQLLHHSDRDTTITYSILDSSLPLLDYVATLRLKPVTDGNQTFWDWRAKFRAPAARAAELEHLVGRQVFEAGFTGMRTFLTEQAPPSTELSGKTETAVVVAAAGENLPSKAVMVAAAGGPEVMSLKDVTVPAPEPLQVRIRQTAIAVNDSDLTYRRGISTDAIFPGIPGLEGVGEIIDVGEQVNGLFPGDRVAYIDRSPGAYAAMRCIDADACIPLPDGLSDLDASTLLKGALAGLLLSRVFRVSVGGSILIQQAAGGVGHLLCQWAKAMDLIVIGTVSTAEKAKFSRDHGCDHPIVVTDDQAPVADVMRITNGRGVDCWVQRGGGHGIEDALACLSRCGHCAIIGDGELTALNLNALKQRSLTVSAPLCFDYFDDRTYLQRMAHQLFAKIQNHTLVPAVTTFPLGQVAEAHRQMEARKTTGAVALIPAR